MTGYPVILNGDHAEFENEYANTPPHERPDWPLPSFDARDWATAFLSAYEKAGDDFLDEGTMIAWFANALMRGFDEATARHSNHDLVVSRDALLRRVAALEEALKPFGKEADARGHLALGPDIDHWPIGGSALTYGDLRRAALALKSES